MKDEDLGMHYNLFGGESIARIMQISSSSSANLYPCVQYIAWHDITGLIETRAKILVAYTKLLMFIL